MKKKYRIKEVPVFPSLTRYVVQVRTVFGIWVSVKKFADYDNGFARREAEDLLEKLEER